MRALILAADGVEDSELLYPYYRLQEEGIPVDVAAPEAGTVTGKHGYRMDANKSFADLLPVDYDLLILPGGKGSELVRIHDRAVEAAREMFRSGKPVAAICHGLQVLISADVLKGKKATCYKTIRDDIRAAGASYVDEEVVVDGNLITSRFPADLPAFCREIFRAMK